ncbi:unnamed protein product [Strongylus vulgaris]|uniref:Uncharacterized protein n=1 Tax=Strongylus vulgaris TaxID=40348 RepID=A0A3P7I144_STRVU|nr:unnamed protein product [Strongylus vulgaris]
MENEPATMSRPKVLSSWSVNPTTVMNSRNSPYEKSYANMYPATSPESYRQAIRTMPEKIQQTSDAVTSTFSLADSSFENGTLTPRNAPRQASFIAAMTRQTMSEDEGE